MTSHLTPNSRTISSGFAYALNAVKKFFSPENTSSTPVMPIATMVAAVTPFFAARPAKLNAFSMCWVSRG
jgi:hypothetical protein